MWAKFCDYINLNGNNNSSEDANTNGQIDRDTINDAQELSTKNKGINWNNFWNTVRDNIETWWD